VIQVITNKITTVIGVIFLITFYIGVSTQTVLAEETIPAWIKNNAGWWADGQIDDNSFVSGIQWLISNDVMIIPHTEQGTGDGSNVIPAWIKNNAGWWADGQIDDTSFIQNIQFLIENRIIKINQKFDENLSNFVITGDLAVNANTKENLKNIEKVDPEIILFVGDLRNDDGSPVGWFEMTEFLGKDRIRIAVGNHDVDHQNEYQTYYNLPKEFYSFDFGNVHFIILATDSNIWIAGEQFQFLSTDLQSTANNSAIDWIIVGLHKPIYSDGMNILIRDSKNIIDLEHMIYWRTIVQPLFDNYGVDLVLQGHNQFYERFKPLSFDSIVTDNNSSNYADPQGQIYVTVGTGGHKIHEVPKKSDLSEVQHKMFGFLKLTPDGKTLNGEFISLDEEVIDKFQIKKQNLKPTSNFDIPQYSLSGTDLSNSNLFLRDFTNADLSYTNLRNADLTYADLSNSNLTGADLRGINLHGTNLVGVDLSGTNLTGANLSFQNLSSMDVSSIILDNTILYNTNLSGTNLSGKNLSGLNIKLSNLKFTDFEFSDLSFAHLTNSVIYETNFSHTNLENAHINDAYITNTDFSNSNISGVNFHHSFILSSDFRDTKLDNVDFSNARLADSNFDSQDFQYVDLTNADFSSKTVEYLPEAGVASATIYSGAFLNNADLSNKDLSSVIFARENFDPYTFTPSGLNSFSPSVIEAIDVYLASMGISDPMMGTTNLSGANLSGANLSGKNISQIDNLSVVKFFEADLSNADLSGSVISLADLRFADLSNSNLKNTNFSYANLSGANLSGANLSGAILDGAILDGAILGCINHTICD